MENAVKSRLQSVQFGEAQTYKSIAILPLISPADGTFQYRTLGEALATWDIAITEVSAGGSVPDVMVVNRGNKCVLLIDGEELAGANRNRVLNTSILIKEVSETKIPVSCTEQGRWSYASQAFSESGHVTLQMLGRFPEARDTSDEAIPLLVRLSHSTENPKLASAIATALDGRKTILRKLNEQ